MILYTRKNIPFQIDKEDLELASQYTWHVNKKGYCMARDGDTMVLLHRLLMGSPKSSIDHKNRDKTDNRKKNLRVCSQSQNLVNRGMLSNNTSGYRGVSKSHGKWTSMLGVDGKNIYLGTFEDIVDAAKAYNDKAKELYGEFAELNKIRVRRTE